MKEKFIALFTSRPAKIGVPLAILLIGILVSVSQAKLSKPTYTANARIWIPMRLINLSRDGEIGAAQGDSALTVGPNALRTACEIIHSDAVTKLAYESLQAKLGDKCPPAVAIQSGLRAKPVESTDILELAFSNVDPDVTVAVVQSCIDAFFRENNMQVTEPIQERKNRLEQQLKVAQKEYSKIKTQVKQFQDSSTFIDLQSDVQTLNTQKQDLEKNLEESKHELSSVKSRLEYAQKQLGFGPESVVAVQKLADDEIMRSLRSHIAETEVALIGLRSKYQDEHPKVKRLKASLDEAKKGLDARYMSIVGKPGLKDVIVGGGAIGGAGNAAGSGEGAAKGVGGGISENAQARMISEMAESSTTIASLNAKISSLSASLGSVRAKLSSVPAKQMELADIRRQDELATNSLTAVERELQKIHLNESADGGSSSMQVIDSPSITGTSAPNTIILNMALTGVLAGLVAAAQFFLSPKFISPNKLSQFLNVPTAGYIPVISNERGRTSALASSMDRIRLNRSDWFGVADPLPIAVTSGDRGDGKSLLAFSLASSLADAGEKVLLIDADTSAPSIHRMVSISASPGLLQYLDEPTIESFQVMQAVKENLTVIPAGGILDDGTCLKELRFKRLIAEARKNFDAIIIDTPECGGTLDCLVVPQFPCRWLAVVRLGWSSLRAVQNLGTQLDLLPSFESALVVNGVTQKDVNQLRSSASVSRSQGTSFGASDLSPTLPSESETAAW